MPLALMHMTAHNTLIINSIKNLITQKALIGRALRGGEEALLENIKNIILEVASESTFANCIFALDVEIIVTTVRI